MAYKVPFLDLACAFREVGLSSLDLESKEALCFFANLYHLLVRHMLLVLGAPSSAKVTILAGQFGHVRWKQLGWNSTFLMEIQIPFEVLVFVANVARCCR